MVDWTDRIGRRLKLHDLHILLAVVQCGSMAKAARELAVSNPVVSKAIADLEQALGVRLLDRGRQGVEVRSMGVHCLIAASSHLTNCGNGPLFLHPSVVPPCVGRGAIAPEMAHRSDGS